MNAIVESTSSSAPILDSLPYAETVHEDYEEYALALIEDEMKEIAPRTMKKMAPINFRTPMMQTEYGTLVVEGGGGDDAFVRARPKQQLQLFQPSKIRKPNKWKDHDTISSGVLAQIKSHYEAERIRSLVLEVEKEEGVTSWKDYNASLDESVSFWKNLVQREIDTVEEINFRRQQAQTQQVGPEIDRLNQEYQQALYRRNQLEHAIEGLRRKTESTNETRKRKADELND